MTTVVPEPRSIGFTRPLGGLEHLFSLIDRNRAIHFTMAAQIEGPTSIPAWRAALDKLQERHQLLSVAIEFNNASAPFFRAVRNAPIPLRVIIGPAVWQTEVARELSTPFDPQRAPLARAVLMHGERESATILAQFPIGYRHLAYDQKHSSSCECRAERRARNIPNPRNPVGSL